VVGEAVGAQRSEAATALVGERLEAVVAAGQLAQEAQGLHAPALPGRRGPARGQTADEHGVARVDAFDRRVSG